MVPRTKGPPCEGRIRAIGVGDSTNGISYYVEFKDGSKPISYKQLHSANPHTEFIITVEEPDKTAVEVRTNRAVGAIREQLFGTLLDTLDKQNEARQKWSEWLGIRQEKITDFDLPRGDTASKPEDLKWLQAKFITIGNILKIQNGSDAGHEIGNTNEVRWAKIQYTKKRPDGPMNDYIRVEIQLNESQPKQRCEIWLKEDGKVSITETTHL